jgi:hypothetical protein
MNSQEYAYFIEQENEEFDGKAYRHFVEVLELIRNTLSDQKDVMNYIILGFYQAMY